MMLILGMALTNAFGTQVSVGEIHVLVKDESGGGPLAQAFTAFSKEMDHSDISFEMAQEGVDGRSEVEENKYAGYVEIKEHTIDFYGSSRSAIESNIVQGMVAVFTDKYNAVSAAAKVDPGREAAVLAGAGDRDHIAETSIAAGRTPGSMDYYAVAMAVMIAMWGAMSASALIRSEVVNGTMNRLAAAPVRKGEIFAGKVLGNFVLNAICVLLIVFISKFVFHAYWGDHLGLALAVLLTGLVMAISFGLAVSYLLNGAGARGAIMLIVQLASFFGGAYFPLGDGGRGFWGFIVGLSPIRWGNRALTELIYNSSFTAAWQTIGLNIGLAFLFLGISAVYVRRREGF
jgi:ABC-2 type transport system permease protein